MTKLSVVPLKGDAPRPEVVEKACEFINAVHANKIDGFALVMCNKDGSVTTYITPVEDQFALYWGIERLKHRMMINSDEAQS